MVKWPTAGPTFDSMAIPSTSAADLVNPVDNYVERAEIALHSMLRREFGLLAVAVGRVTSGATGRAFAVANHAEVLLAALDLHGRGEVESVWPLLFARCHDSFEWPARRMRRNHHEIAALLDEFEIALQRWRSGITASTRDDFIGVIDRLTTALNQHLTQEEQLVVPLMNQHITTSEFEAIVETQAFNFEPALQTLLLGMLMLEADAGVVERASWTVAAAVKRRAAAAIGVAVYQPESHGVDVDRVFASITAAVKQRAATEYFHHCLLVHGTVKPRANQ